MRAAKKAAKATTAKKATAAKPRPTRAPAPGVGSAPAAPAPTSPAIAEPDPELTTLAPVIADEPDELVPAPDELAPVIGTDEHHAEIRAQVLADNPELANASERAVDRAVAAAVPAFTERFVARARRAHTLAAIVAPVFPTEAHVAELNAAIPSLTPKELADVFHAGHAAFVASVAAGEPITEAVPA